MNRLKHPKVPEWVGIAGWSAPGEEASTLVCFTTDDEVSPTKITHSRDIIYIDGRLEQDYNFIDYIFEDGLNAITARYYLDENEIKISFPDETPTFSSAELAAAHIKPAILLYFKKRFRTISIVTSEGYETLWKI